MLTRITGTGDGSAPVVNITFPIIDDSHLQATVNDVPAGLVWTGPSQVTFASAVPVGAIWHVFRKTPTEPGIVTYTDAAPIRASDLNMDDKSHRYRDEELLDAIEDQANFTLRAPEQMAELPAAADRKGTVLGFSVANGLRELLNYSALASKLLPFLSSLVGTVMKGDPGSPGEGYSTRAAMASRASPQLLDDVYLNEKGREGKFVVDDASEWSAAIAADTRQGIFVQSTADPTKVYRRVYDGPINVRWFGAVADGTTDDSPAVVGAIDTANSLYVANYGFAGGGHGVPTVRFPTGVYWMGATTLDIIKTIILEGESAGDSGGAASVLKWADATTGIRVQMNNTVGAIGTQPSADYAGTGSIIRNLHLIGGYNNVESEAHGIHLRARASIQDVVIYSFPGDAIRIQASAGAGTGYPYEGNANSWEVRRVLAVSNRGGLVIIGADVNAGLATAFSAIANRGWAIDDSSFLGNTFVATHAASNGSPYRTTNLNAQSVFVGCYSESGGPPSTFTALTIILGGQMAAGVTGGVYFSPTTNGEIRILADLIVRASSGYINIDSLDASTAGLNFFTQGVNIGGIQAINGQGVSYATPAGTKHLFNSNAGGWDATIDGTGIDLPTAGRGYHVQGFQVVGPRQGAIADDASGAPNQTTVNAILAALRAHGLIS